MNDKKVAMYVSRREDIKEMITLQNRIQKENPHIVTSRFENTDKIEDLKVAHVAWFHDAEVNQSLDNEANITDRQQAIQRRDLVCLYLLAVGGGNGREMIKR